MNPNNKLQQLVKTWFDKWETGDFQNLPITDDFKHTSPFGTIDGKKAYVEMVKINTEKFLGYTFKIHDQIYGEEHACVRYTAKQGDTFQLDVSEWYYMKGDLIKNIIAYYHIGEIRADRKLNE